MKAIVAVDKNWAIGKDGDLLAHLPGDMKYFREKTKGKAIIIGRKTLESFPGGKPLPGRINIVLTRNEAYEPEEISVHRDLHEYFCEEGNSHGTSKILLCTSVDDVKSMLAGARMPEAFICGGGEIYRRFIEDCSEALVTKIDAKFEADTFFPDLDEHPSFECVYESEDKEENGTRYRFTTYKNNSIAK